MPPPCCPVSGLTRPNRETETISTTGPHQEVTLRSQPQPSEMVEQIADGVAASGAACVSGAGRPRQPQAWRGGGKRRLANQRALCRGAATPRPCWRPRTGREGCTSRRLAAPAKAPLTDLLLRPVVGLSELKAAENGSHGSRLRRLRESRVVLHPRWRHGRQVLDMDEARTLQIGPGGAVGEVNGSAKPIPSEGTHPESASRTGASPARDVGLRQRWRGVAGHPHVCPAGLQECPRTNARYVSTSGSALHVHTYAHKLCNYIPDTSNLFIQTYRFAPSGRMTCTGRQTAPRRLTSSP